jgi:hypothetical protein
MIKLSELDTWCVERARKPLEEVSNGTGGTHCEMAYDFGHMQYDCRRLLEIIDSMIGRDGTS